MQSIKIKLNKDLSKYKKGDKIVVQLNHYWNKRIKESETDNCLEVIKEDKKKISESKKYKRKKEGVKNDNHFTA